MIDPFLNVPELHGLNRKEKAEVEYFLTTPGKDEFFFFLTLFGKTPAQVRNMMIEEFIHRYSLDLFADAIAIGVPSQRSWQELDIIIAQFSKMVDEEEYRNFWDRMRYVLAALPKRKDYGNKYKARHVVKSKRPKQGWGYTMCRHCWRIVPYNPQVTSKTKPLCFMHDLPAENLTYRKHDRLHRKLWSEQRVVLPKLKEVLLRDMSDADVRKAVQELVTTPNDAIPRLVEYLKGIGHNNEPESLLWAFHGPASEKMRTLYKEAVGEFIHTILTTESAFEPGQPLPYFLSINELSCAEAWLTLLEHGRRRKDD